MLAIIVLAFIWLLKETDCLRVRLPYGATYPEGACCDWRMLDSDVTDDMKHELIKSWGKNITALQNAMFSLDNMAPLMGWGYAYQFQNFKPPCRVELISEHTHYTIQSDCIPLLKDAFRVYRNPKIKVNLKTLTCNDRLRLQKA